MILIGVSVLAFLVHYLSNTFVGRTKPNPEYTKILEKIEDLEKQAEAVNSPSTFSAYSKLKRTINQLHKDKTNIPSTKTPEAAWLLKFMPYVVCLGLVGYYEEVKMRGETTFWPFSSMLGYQEGKFFYFSLVPWYLLSLYTAKVII